MIVSFYESVQNHTGCQTIEVAQADTLRTLIDLLGKQFGESFQEYLLGDDTCFFLVNGKSILHTGGLHTPLKPEDRVEILPVVEAG